MFRRQKVPKKLSADELKLKLYSHFDKSGSLNLLRTQIRSQLASEILKMAPSSSAVSESNKTVDLDNTLLPIQVCNWLVYDHLIKQGYQYTLSTFVSETNLPYPEKLLAVGDILALVGLDNSSSEFKRISDLYSTSNEKEGLHSLLLAIIKSVIFMPYKNDQLIENVVNSSSETGNKNVLPSTCIKQMAHAEPGNLVETLREKSLGVKELHESTSLESYQKQIQFIKDDKEKEIQNVRHKLVQELERLHLQEQSFYQEIEQKRKEIKKEEDLLFQEKEKSKIEKDLFLKEQENKFQKKVREIEDVHVTKLYSRDKEIAKLQEELKEKEKQLGHREFELSTHRERFDDLKQKLDDQNKNYNSIHDKYKSLLDENTNLVRKFESMADYSILKNELVAKGKENFNLQQDIENLQRIAEKDKKAYTDTVTSLELKLKAIEPRLQSMQKELKQARDTLHIEKAMWHKEKERLEGDSYSTKELYETVLQRIEEQKQDTHDLHQTMHILHYQLTSQNSNKTHKPEIYDPLRTIPKVAVLPSKDNHHIFKLNNSNPVSISQQYREKALSFTSEYKNRLNKLQQKVDETYDKYSLIYPTSFDTKMPSIKPSLSHSSPMISQHTKFYHPFSTKSISNNSTSFQLDTLKSSMLSENLKYRSATVSTFMNRNTFDQLNDAVISAPNFNDCTKTFVSDSTNVESIKNKNVNYGIFSPQSEQTFRTSEMFKPSSSINKLPEKYLVAENFENSPSLSNRTDQQIRFDTNKKTETLLSGIVETNSIGLRENTLQDIRVLEVGSTEITKNAYQKIPTAETLPTANSVDIPTMIGVSHLTTTSSKLSFQHSNNSSTEPALVFTNMTVKDSAVPQTYISPDAPLNSLKQYEAAPIVDLDAAWKRKTSLPTVHSPSLQNSNSLMFSKNITPDDIVSKEETKHSVSDISSHPDNKEQHITTKLLTETSLCPKTIEYAGNLSIPITDDQNTKNDSAQFKDSNEDQARTPQAEAMESDSEKLADYQNNSKSVDVGIVIGTGEEIKEKTESYDGSQVHKALRQIPEDSLSELSEIHMSCGSEQEEQREESDNW